MAEIGIVGLGAMGLGIAQVFAQAGCRVIATDQHPGARDTARDRLLENLEGRVKAGKLRPDELDATMALLTVTDNLHELSRADMIIEAVVEDLVTKQTLFLDLENIVRPDAVLATNTSALSVGALAQGLAGRERVLGLHFFNPAPAMRLVELVAHPGTDQAALTTARTLTEAAGKTVVQCADRPGFIVNRCARPFYGEALALFEEGRTASDIDAAMMAAGYRMGPFALIDLIGADINLAATVGLARAMDNHPRYHVFQALADQVARGDLGRKTGRGFLFPDAPGPAPEDAALIRLRIESTLANEAASLLAEGAVGMDDIDTALKLGLNFPRGPFESARALGPSRVRAELERLEGAASAPLKGRYMIAAPLRTM